MDGKIGTGAGCIDRKPRNPPGDRKPLCVAIVSPRLKYLFKNKAVLSTARLLLPQRVSYETYTPRFSITSPISGRLKLNRR